MPSLYNANENVRISENSLMKMLHIYARHDKAVCRQAARSENKITKKIYDMNPKLLK